MTTTRAAFLLFALAAFACSGSVDVHGVPTEIQLDAPFCVPPKDAGISDAPTDSRSD